MRTRSILVLSVLLAATCTQGAELELVTNGGFEPPLSDGWTATITGTGATIDLDQFADPDLDFELLMTKGGGTGAARVNQELVLPNLDADVSVALDCDVTASGGAWAAGGLMLQYIDAQGMVLGQTAIAQRSADCPWQASDTFHLIDVEVGGWWNHDLNVAAELDNLPGVPREAVCKLGVILFVEAGDC
jgi:hypothetical protein